MPPDLHWSQHTLACRDLTVRYDETSVLSSIDLTVAPDEMVAILGPSGSGKSTLLHAVAGFVPPATGEIWIAGRQVATATTTLPPEKREVGMVFQNYALWPHLSVLDTVAYPLRRAGARRGAARREAADLLERLDLAELASRRPAQLSGGQQQRVGLARALARRAALYLFDEPTAHLDTHLRERFSAELLARRRAAGAAALYATHDAGEALALADRVALLADGRIVHVGTPVEVYSRPVSLWAARLTGPASLLQARVSRVGPGALRVELDGQVLEVSGGGACPAPRDEPARVLVRPDWAYVGGPFGGRVTNVFFRGPYTDYLLDTPGGEVLVRHPGAPEHARDTLLSWGLHRAWVLDDTTVTAGAPPEAASDAPSGQQARHPEPAGAVAGELPVGDREMPLREVSQ